MSETCSISIELPDELASSAESLEVLRTVFQTIITLSRECGRQSNPQLQGMIAGNWKVTCGLNWTATAERGAASRPLPDIPKKKPWPSCGR